jgi:hypothetical protein
MDARPQASGWQENSFRASVGWTFTAHGVLTVFEAPERCVLLLVAEHTRSANPYQLLYAALGIDEPEQPRTKPPCCDSEGQPPVDPDLVA